MGEAFDSLRQEMQRDRIELVRLVTDGFNRIEDKLDNTAEEISDLAERVTQVEDNQRTIRRTIGGAVSAVFAAFVGYIFTMFGR